MSQHNDTQLNFADILQQLTAFTAPGQNAHPTPGAESFQHSDTQTASRSQVVEAGMTSMHSSSHIPSLAAQPSALTALDHIARLQEITAAATAMPQPQSSSNSTNFNEASSYALQNSFRVDHHSVTDPPGIIARSNEIDPTTILEWPPALRHVSKLGSRGDDLMIGVKQMMKDQKGNERDWWAERVKRKAALRTTDDAHPELRIYDKKLYKALGDMQAAFTVRLKELGVPFFGVPTENITKIGDDEVEGKISEKKLRELQRKMIDYLEAMYED